MNERPSGSVVAVALARRDLRRYFGSATAYVFITLFVLLSAAAAFWRPRFFLNNLANLDELNGVFPVLLLFFVPALCMGLWSDERKQGTDELLLTLPARASDLVAGKYLAALGIYTVSVVVSLSDAAVLRWLGHPDWGLLAANYLGFWLLGAALIPAAMCASAITANATIAFILGCAFCAVPIGIGLTVYFEDFTRGVVSLAGLVALVGFAALLLRLNMLILDRRHWRRGSGSVPMAAHAAVRMAAAAVIVSCVLVLATRLHARADLTAEHLYRLSGATRNVLTNLPADRPLLVQAFVSTDMPEPLVQTRENLLGMLREFAAHASTVTVDVEETEPFSDSARLARERYGIAPRDVVDPATGEVAHDVYLGVAVSSGPAVDVVPFLDRGLSPEYELARAVRVVTQSSRKKVGVIDTAINVLGGRDRTEPHAAWQAIDELRKQYDVIEVQPAHAPEVQVDALLVVQPSRLTQTDLDLVMQPILRGVPTLLLLDPLPLVNLGLAPAADLASRIDPYRPEPATRLVFGNIREALARIDLNWVPARVAWDRFNPHPGIADLPQGTLFVGTGNGNAAAFDKASTITGSLDDVLLVYPGVLLSAGAPNFTFEPLLETGVVSGVSSFFDLVVPTPDGLALGPDAGGEPDGSHHAVAAAVRSAAPVTDVEGARPVQVVAIADLDFISDDFFELRRSASSGVSFDNVTLFLNAVDTLAGDESFIALRNHRPRHRTLERVEAQTQTFLDRRVQEEQQAEKESAAALEEARGRVRKRIDEVNAREDLDAQARSVLVRTVEESENRQLKTLEAALADARNAKIRASRERMEGEVRRIRTRIRTAAVLWPPLPMLAVGAVLFMRRRRLEREGERATGRVRDLA